MLGVPDRERIVADARATATDQRQAESGAWPSSFDWRGRGVTPVKSQGSCGSCVAFACVAALESAVLIETGKMVNLSEGDLFFCNGNRNCTEGWDPGSALGDLELYGACDSVCCPYANPSTGLAGACLGCNNRANRVVRTSGQQHYSSPDTFRLHISAFGPLVACLQIYEDFIHYSGGTYTHVAGKSLEGHCVEVVGYSDDANVPGGGYWIIKNSWGTWWGESGFCRIAYGQCGIDEAMWEITRPVTVSPDIFLNLLEPAVNPRPIHRGIPVSVTITANDRATGVPLTQGDVYEGASHIGVLDSPFTVRLPPWKPRRVSPSMPPSPPPPPPPLPFPPPVQWVVRSLGYEDAEVFVPTLP